ncbi:phosphatase 2C-like domain-containing protein [Dipodascopsis uninucleata]
MPAPMRLSLLVAAYPTITAALLFAFRRLQWQYPFLDRIIVQQSRNVRLLKQQQQSHSTSAQSSSIGLAPSYTGTNTGIAGNSNGPNNGVADPLNGKQVGNVPFQYCISPSFHAKDRRVKSSRRTSTSSGASSTKISNRPATGEDAFFYQKLKDQQSVALGVIDGVGGWNEIGVDATEFSSALADTLTDMASQLSATDETPVKDELSKFSFPPLVLLDAAYNSVKNSGSVLAGGSTACIGVAHGNGTLQTANLGDSGFFIFRDGRIHYMSSPQTHYFNAPYQLAIIPQKLLEQNSRYGGKHFDDKPADANLATHKLKHGDVILFCTDGVLDNLAPNDCLRIINEEMVNCGNWILEKKSGSIKPSENREFTGSDIVAKRVVSQALKASLDSKTDGPFALEAQRQMHVLYKGGKPDDITALVMFVQQK